MSLVYPFFPLVACPVNELSHIYFGVGVLKGCCHITHDDEDNEEEMMF